MNQSDDLNRVSHAEWHPASPRDARFVGRDLIAMGPQAAALLGGAALVALCWWLPREWHAGGMIYAVFTSTSSIYRSSRRAKANPDVLDLMDLPSEVPQYPVTAVFEVDGTRYGEDHGVVTFIEGWLHFQGRLTSFGVRAADVVPGWKREKKPNDAPGPTDYDQWLSWRRDGHRFGVAFEAMEGYRRREHRAEGLRVKFDRDFYDWATLRSPADGKPVLPPIVPQPGVVSRLTVVEALGAMLLPAWVLPPALLLGWVHTHHPFRDGTLAVIAGCLGLYTVLRALRADRTLASVALEPSLALRQGSESGSS